MPDKRRVAGTVDRIEGNAVVVVFKDPDSGDTREAVVNKMKLKRVELKEGDPVTVELSMLEADLKVTQKEIDRSVFRIGLKPAPKKSSARKPKKA